MPHPFLQDVHALGEAAFGERGLFDQAGEVVDAAAEPARLRPAGGIGRLAFAVGEDAVAELRLGDVLGEVALIVA